MAPKYRQLHTKTLDSFDFNEMEDDFTRVCWLLLPLIVDSAGRGIYNMAWIRSKMFPIRPDVTVEQLQSTFDWLSERKMIQVYKVEEREYFFIPKWKTYQSGTHKEMKSTLPEPSVLVESQSGVSPELLKSQSKLSQELVPAVVNVPESASATASVNESVNELDLVSEKPAHKQKILSERPEIYSIYESNIGLLTPIIAEDLDDAVNMYSFEWVCDAIQEAVRNEKRNYKYALAILKRWKQEGRNSVKKKPNQEVVYSEVYE